MGRIEFGELVLSNIFLYGIVLFFTVIVYYCVLKRLYISLLDPFFINQLFSLFAFSVAIFLWIMGVIQFQYGLQFILSQIAFWIGLHRFSIKPIKQKIIDSNHYQRSWNFPLMSNQTLSIYLYASFLFIVVQLYVYMRLGIPLFKDSRLTMYEDSGGLGIFGRILEILSIFIVFGSFYLRKVTSSYSTLRVLANFILVFYIFTCMLSGSKGAIISLFSLYFLFLLMYEPNYILKIRKIEIVAFVITIFAAVFVISIQNTSDSSLLLLIDRIIGSGDVFYQGYYSDKVSAIQANIFTLFSDFLGTFRLVPWSDLPRPIGMQLYQQVYNVDISMGANARHNYLGLLCFGFLGSILFSYIIGWFYSYIRSKLYNYFYRGSVVRVSLYITLLLGAGCVETDFTMLVTKVDSFILSVTFLICLFIFYVLFSWLVGRNVEKYS